MTDITIPVTRLRASYLAYQDAKKDTRQAIKRKYRAIIEEEIDAALTAQKVAFARELRDTKEQYNLSVNVIQDNVLRTRNWRVWEDLRDLAQIDPEQVIQANARAEAAVAKQGYRYEDGILTMLRNHAGDEMEPMQFDVEKWRENPVGLAPALDMDAFVSYGRSFSDPHAFNNHVKKVLNGLTS